jgi:cobalt-precorrin 5A hydrolase
MFEPEGGAGRPAPPPERPATAVYALTPAGARLGRALARELGADLFVTRRLEPDHPGATAFDALVPFVGTVFAAYRRHVFVAAAGIVVRAVAAHLRGKGGDPAVVALDQRGRFAVSLVSGHLGGANALAREVAAITAGTAVVTTATDTEDLPALDVLAAERGLAIADLGAVKAVNIALLAGDPVQVLDPDDRLGLRGAPGAPEPWPGHFVHLPEPGAWRPGLPGVRVTERAVAAGGGELVLHPPCLAVGLGCRRGASADEIVAAVEGTLAGAGLSPLALLGLASIGLKRDEAGLLEAAARLGKAILFYETGDLKDIAVPNPSARVQRETGVPGVCEAAAMKLAGTKDLLVQKTRCGNVTVAVALAG